MFKVELRSAPLPLLGWFADHYYFVVHSEAGKDRFEVWQRANRCPTSQGHLHQNLLPWDAGVGAGPSSPVALWYNGEAEALNQRIQASMHQYPWRQRYWAWPGPNSNSYIQWILGKNFQLPPRAIGYRWALQRSAENDSE